MKYPDDLYYLDEIVSLGFGKNPPGTLSLSRFIQNKPCWRQTTQQSIQKPKTLIFADWTASTWSWSKKTAMTALIQQLEQDGFKLYAWSDDALMAIDPTFRYQSVTPGTTAQITAAAAAHALSADKIHILDDYSLQALFLTHQPERHFNLSDYMCSPYEATKILRWLKQATPTIDTLVLDEVDIDVDTDNDRYSYYLREATKISQSLGGKVLINITKIYFVDSDFNMDKMERIERLADDVVKSEIPMTDTDKAILEKITELTLSGKEVPSLIIKLSHMPKLEVFKYRDCQQLGHILPTLSTLKRLESLSLNSSTLHDGDLIAIFNHMPQLFSLDLSGCKNVSNSDLSTLGPLQNLMALDFSGSDINVNDLATILRNAPHLQALDLCGCRLERGDISFDMNLDHIRSLNLSHSGISGNSLITLLNRTPNLQDLHLESFLGDLLPSLSGLKSLESLYSLAIYSLNDATFSKIQQLAPRLRSLTYTGVPKKRVSLYVIGQFEHLNALALRDIETRSEAFSAMLHGIKHLKVLTLSHCDISPNKNASNRLESLYQYTNRGALEHLESFTSEGRGGLPSILHNAPHLNVLHLKNMDLSQHDVSILPLDLSSIQSLIMHNVSNVSNVTLRELLKRMPYLQGPYLWSLFDELRRLEKRKQEAGVAIPQLQVKPPANPVHNPNAYVNKKPHTQAVFQFKGMNKTKNQSMMIEKISQYIAITSTHAALTPHIQDGICNGLCYWYAFQDDADFNPKLNAIAAWDGRSTLDSPLSALFEELIAIIKTHQLGPETQIHYLGDDAHAWLPLLPSPAILNNPWHAIALKPLAGENKTWIYDPNYVNGPMCVFNDDLPQAIQDSIGAIVSIKGASAALIPPSIHDNNRFIQAGGLFALNYCNNLHPKSMSYSPAALKGLLLRDNKGVPAWVHGIKNPSLTTYTVGLLAQLVHHHADASVLLSNSMDALEPLARHVLINALHTQIPGSVSAELMALLSNAMRKTPPNVDYYRTQLKTWLKDKPFAHSVAAYCQRLIANPNSFSNQLIELTTSKSVHAMQLALQQYCLSTSRPVFYVDTPDDLICQAPYVCRNHEGLGILTDWNEGPGSPLLQFIRDHQNRVPSPVIIVNYDHFNAGELVRFNALLDDMPKADGIELPKNTQIIGLINPSAPNRYQGADFYSRMDHVECAPFSEKELLCAIPPRPILGVPKNSSVYNIHLFHAADWKERLLGRPFFQEGVLTFDDGELNWAIRSGLPIVIENGLWNTDEFQSFWDNAWLRNEIKFNGDRIYLPENIALSRRDGYDWLSLSEGLQVKNGVNAAARVINPTRLIDCFYQLECDNTAHTSNESMGFLEASAHGTLSLTITRSLSVDEWAMLLVERQMNHVNLTCYLAPGVHLPKELAACIPIEETAPLAVVHPQSTRLIQSTDPDTTIAQFTQTRPNWLVLDVSECSASDLLRKIDAQCDVLNRKFQFTESFGALHNALAHHQNIILTGRFSVELADDLAPLLFNRQSTQPNTSELLIIGRDLASFHYYPVETHAVGMEEKKMVLACQYLEHEISPLITAYPNESLARLLARLNYQACYPHEPTDNAWQGIGHLVIHLPNIPWCIETSANEANLFNQKRRDAVYARWNTSAFVFLTGLTGVGKSTFVERCLSGQGNTLFHHINKAAEWADATHDGLKILFIDEANLSSRQWSEFEGLFNHPPGILIDGVYHALSAQHKVVFAGNPLNYSGRQLPSFFLRHGNALVFDPLPNAFIYEEIIKPVFHETPLEALSEAIARELLDVYQFLCKHAKTAVLISPREIQMMALLVLSFIEQNSHIDAIHAAQYYRYQIAKPLVPNEHLTAFEAAFALKKDLPRPKWASRDSDYTFTASRQTVKNSLIDLLQLSQYKRKMPLHAHDAKRYGGLNGIVIEGAPGVGKSELVKATLHELGFEKQDYYEIPPSMGSDEKKRVLLQAFHEGAVVIADEINSSSMMEELMNDLLMGKTPEKERPNHPGFLLIGTQNPATMAGRKSTGEALARRLLTIKLPDYSQHEMRDIVNALGVGREKADVLVDIYLETSAYAEKHHLSPAPSFRDLIKLAKIELKISTDPVAHFSPPKTTDAGILGACTLMGLYKSALANRDEPIDEEPSSEDSPSTVRGGYSTKRDI